MAPTDARKKLEQIRRNKKGKKNQPKSSNFNGNSNSNVKDLRQLIKVNRRSDNKSSPNKVQSGRVTKASSATKKDLRDSNRKLATRKSIVSPATPRGAAIRNESSLRRSERADLSSKTATSANNPPSRRITSSSVATARPRRKQVQYYVPPHMQPQHPATYIIAPAAAPQPTKLAMDSVSERHQTGAVLVTNLPSIITQSEIIELFGDVGVMHGVNMINPNTALVTYQTGRDAVEAVKVYHNRLLDGKPMQVYMMPNSSTTTPSIRSRIQ